MTGWVRLAIWVAVTAVATPASAQDVAKGEAVFRPCRACHVLGESGKKKIPLKGVVGRKAGAVPGYAYSEAMTQAGAGGLVWTEAKLALYLESPDTFLPQGVMAFAGVKDPGQLQDLIAFLKSQR